MKRNEKQTREELIDPKLQLAGWNVLDKKYVVEKGKACIETPVSGMPKTHENPSGNGFVDYTMISNQLEQFCEESGISKTVATEKIYRNILRNISVDWKKSVCFSNNFISKRCQKYTEKYFESEKEKVDKFQFARERYGE